MTLPGDFAEKIWVPDTFFANDKHSFLHDVTEKNKMVRLYGDGSIEYGMRYVSVSVCLGCSLVEIRAQRPTRCSVRSISKESRKFSFI